MPLLPAAAACGFGAVRVVRGGDMVAEEKSPKSLPKDSLRIVVVGGEVGFGGGAGLASKKLPPLRGLDGFVVEGCRAWDVGEVKPEKGVGAGAAGTCGEAKEREEKASFMPPILLC